MVLLLYVPISYNFAAEMSNIIVSVLFVNRADYCIGLDLKENDNKSRHKMPDCER